MNDEQFLRRDGRIEIEFLSGLVAGANDFDGEVRTAQPERAMVHGLGVVQEYSYIGNAVVLLPVLHTIAHIDPRTNLPKSRPSNHFLKNRG